jgi:hypothetical protein
VEGETVPEGDDGFDVVRDTTFSRVVMDAGIVLPMPAEIEIACIQFGQTVKRLEQRDGKQGVALDTVATEVARLRMDYSTALTMVMNILRTGVDNDIYSAKGIISTLSKWVDGKKDGDGDQA